MKKYSSIAEASSITGLSVSRLRYIEKCDRDFKAMKVRDRRYYTLQNIQYLQNKYCTNKDLFIIRIDLLIGRLQDVLRSYAL